MWKTFRRKRVNLVLESGGVKVIGELGAIKALQFKGFRFYRISGTSGGAIVGSLLAAGMKPDRIIQRLKTLDITEFAKTISAEDTRSWINAGMSVIRQKWVDDGSNLEAWLQQELAEHGVRTWADLRLPRWRARQLPANKRYKLVVMTTDLKSGETIRLPWDYHKLGLDPDTQSVAKAIRASASIPFLYRPVKVGDRQLIDGAITAPYPLEIFDDDTKHDTIGITVTTAGERKLVRRGEHPVNLTRALLRINRERIERLREDDPEQLRRTIQIDTAHISDLHFAINRDEQVELIYGGLKAGERFVGEYDHGQR